MKRTILWTLIINVVLVSALYTKYFIFRKEQPMVAYASQDVDVHPVVQIGPVTESFIQKLTNTGLNLTAIANQSRSHLTAKGVLVTSSGDNFQIFEYLDSETAQSEASALVEKYSASARSDVWKKNMRIYLDGNLVIFYMGKSVDIITALEHNTSQVL